LAIPLGIGHEFYTRYGGDKGVNAKEIMSDDIDPISVPPTGGYQGKNQLTR
jgi:hypothetical protein